MDTITQSITLEDHLLIHRLLALDEFVSSDSCMGIYTDLGETGKFDLISEVEERASADSFSIKITSALEALTSDLSELLGAQKVQFEPWIAKRFKTGGAYNYHDDCGSDPSNERLYSIELIVKVSDFGGSIHFPNLNKTVGCSRGRILIWRNLDQDNNCDGKVQHATMPVGELGSDDDKMILTTYVRLKKYDSGMLK